MLVTADETCSVSSYNVVTQRCCFLQQGKETQLLHVFEEDLILGFGRTEPNEMSDSSQTGDKDSSVESIVLLFYFEGLSLSKLVVSVCFSSGSRRPVFSARFFLVVVELTPSGRSLLHMWHLQLDAQPITMGELTNINQFKTAKKVLIKLHQTNIFFFSVSSLVCFVSF